VSSVDVVVAQRVEKRGEVNTLANHVCGFVASEGKTRIDHLGHLVEIGQHLAFAHRRRWRSARSATACA
jgi:hypothetical protein